MTPLALPATSLRAFQRLAADLGRIFGPRFVALVAYSHTARLAFTETLADDDLEACGAMVQAWRHDGLATPLLLTPGEFRRSLDAFPLEYQAILDRHAIIAGRFPFDGCRVGDVDLRRAVEV